MSAIFSSISLETRLELRDLLSRFCHALDHNKTNEWIDLFSLDAIVDAPRLGMFKGREEIARIPVLVHEIGGGGWRHFLHNVYFERAGGDRDFLAQAYCTVSDWRTRGNVVRCWDFSARISKRRTCKIIDLTMKSCSDGPVAVPETVQQEPDAQPSA